MAEEKDDLESLSVGGDDDLTSLAIGGAGTTDDLAALSVDEPQPQGLGSRALAAGTYLLSSPEPVKRFGKAVNEGIKGATDAASELIPETLRSGVERIADAIPVPLKKMSEAYFRHHPLMGPIGGSVEATINMMLPTRADIAMLPLGLAGKALSGPLKAAKTVAGAAKAASTGADTVKASESAAMMANDLKRVARIVSNAEDMGVDATRALSPDELSLYKRFEPAIRASVDKGVPLDTYLSDSQTFRFDFNKPAGPGAKIGHVLGGNERPPDLSETLDFDNIKTPEDAWAAVESLAKSEASLLPAQKRGVRPWAKTEEAAAAELMGLSVDELRAIVPGTIKNAEGARAVVLFNQAAVINAHKMAVQAAGLGTLEAKAKAANAFTTAMMTTVKDLGIAAEQGRALNARKIPLGEGEQLVKAFKQIVSSWGGETKLDDIISNLAKLDPNDPAAIKQFLRQSLKATTVDQIVELRRFNLLSGMPTHARNILGSLVTLPSRGVGEKVMEAGVDAVRAGVTRTPRRVFFGEASEEIKGAAQAAFARRPLTAQEAKGLSAFQAFYKTLPEAWGNAFDAMWTGISKFDSDRLEAGRTQIDAIKGPVGAVVRSPLRALLGADEFFKTITARAVMRAQAYRVAAREGKKGAALLDAAEKLVDKPTDEMIKASNYEAAYRTFTDDLGELGSTIIQARNKVPYGLGHLQLPFLKTPMNVSSYALIDRTPLGILKMAAKARKAKTLDYPGVTDDIAKQVVGALAATSAHQLYQAGLMTGGGPRDPGKRAVWLNANQPYSIRIGDQWLSLSSIDPASTHFELVGEFGDLKEELGTMVDDSSAYNAVVPALANSVMSKTWMRSVSDLFKAVADPARYGKQFLNRMAVSFVPGAGALRMVARGVDPVLRRPTDLKSSVQAMTPGESVYVPPVRDIFGRPIIVQGSGPERAVSPFRRIAYVKDFPSRELARLQVEANQIRRVVDFPGESGKKIRTELLPDEYDEVLVIAGKRTQKLVAGFTSKASYKNLRDDQRAFSLQRMVSEARSSALAEYKAKNFQRLKERAK